MWTYNKLARSSKLMINCQSKYDSITTWTVPWVESHCPFSSGPQCQRCCCIVAYGLSHFNLKVTDLNSTEQQSLSGPLRLHTVVQSIHSFATLMAWNILAYHSLHGIYPTRYIPPSAIHHRYITPSTWPCYIPSHTMLCTNLKKKDTYIPWHRPSRLVYTVRQEQVKVV